MYKYRKFGFNTIMINILGCFSERPCDLKPCVNSKKCVNKGSGYECVCEQGWTGEKCEKGEKFHLNFSAYRKTFSESIFHTSLARFEAKINSS
jgi:hypothetical protein